MHHRPEGWLAELKLNVGYITDGKGVRANFLLLWSGEFCEVPFSLGENGHECEATAVYLQEICSRIRPVRHGRAEPLAGRPSAGYMRYGKG
jgi:hypothetical protein